MHQQFKFATCEAMCKDADHAPETDVNRAVCAE